MVTEQQAEAAIKKLKLMIEAAENANQAGEDAVVAAAAGPMMLAALEAVIAATQAYLPPDGISAQECLTRILAATDNPTINAVLRGSNGRS